LANEEIELGDDEAAEGAAGRQFITALARGLDVLSVFRVSDPPLSNQELSKRTGLPRPTISRITYTLTELGYLTYHERFGCYELGGGALVLGHVARANFNALERIRPLMTRLAEFSNGNVGIGVRDRLNMVYLEVVHGPSRIGLRFEVGSQVPLFQTAMGRAYLAGVKREEAAALAKQMRAQHKDAPDDPAHIVELARSEYERLGFCSSAGDWHDDIHGVAVPVDVPELGGMLAINVGAPAYLMPKKRMMTEIGPELVRTASEILDMLAPVKRHAAEVTDQAQPPARRSAMPHERIPSTRSKPRRTAK
jgi:DNA-binding IclR family transcriptional regulator